MDEMLKQILNELQKVNNRLDSMDIRLNRLEEGQEQLRKDIIDRLGTFTEKIAEDVNDKTEVLNKRVYKLEVDIQRLTRQ